MLQNHAVANTNGRAGYTRTHYPVTSAALFVAAQALSGLTSESLVSHKLHHFAAFLGALGTNTFLNQVLPFLFQLRSIAHKVFNRYPGEDTSLVSLCDFCSAVSSLRKSLLL